MSKTRRKRTSFSHPTMWEPAGCTKKPYANEGEALKSARISESYSVPQRVYKCNVCNKFHLTLQV